MKSILRDTRQISSSRPGQKNRFHKLLLPAVSSCVVIGLVAGILWYKDSPAETAGKFIKAVQNDHLESLNAKEEDIRQVQSLLPPPRATSSKTDIHFLKPISTSDNQVKVDAALSVFIYTESAGITSHQGFLRFYLEKTSWFKWKVTNIETLDELDDPGELLVEPSN